MNVTLDAIPIASTLAAGTEIFVLPEDPHPSTKIGGFLAVFSRRTIPRSVRCRALLLAGYRNIGARVDRATKKDLVFGTA